jgi:hypothetical protein
MATISIHKFYDGSKMRRIGAKELKEIPIWKGNRILDDTHAKEIYKAIGGNVRWLDSSIFRIVKYSEMNASGALVEQKYIIDGQHRAWCIKKFFDSDTVCEPDFEVLVIEKAVEDETEAIEYFNSLNNVKAQHWKQDPAILANTYIAALEKKFRGKLIRPGVTKRPYLAAEKLRDALKSCSMLLKPGTENVSNFIDEVVAWNTKELKALEMRMIIAGEKDKGIMENCIEKKFALAFDSRLKWVRDCLTAFK